MSVEIAGEIGNPSLIGVIRQIYLAEASGILEVTQADRKRRFFFSKGELYLPGSHFLGKRLGSLLQLENEIAAARNGSSLGKAATNSGAEATDAFRRAREQQEHDPNKSTEAREQLRELVTRIVDVLVEWQNGRYELLGVPLPTDMSLVGPLPTGYLVMEGTLRDLDPEAALAELGGSDAVVVADPSSRLLLSPYGIDSDEMFLLSRAETSTAVGELLRQLPAPREEGIVCILRLQSVDLLRLSAPPMQDDSQYDQRYSESMNERFLLRFASLLPPEHVPADAEERDQVRALIQRFAGLDHYELLQVPPDADTQAIHDAYQELALRVHPGNAKRLDMVRAAPALGLLFERATEAYLTLEDPERRAGYNIEAGVEITRSVGGDGRNTEQRQVALANSRRAARLLDTGEYHFAMELARQAVRADPKAEYIALLGRIQRRNPNWLQAASDNFKQAIRMDPKNADYRLELAELMEETGHPDRAAVHYQSTLQLSPGNGKAMDGLARVREQQEAAQTGGRSFIGRIKDIWGDSSHG